MAKNMAKCEYYCIYIRVCEIQLAYALESNECIEGNTENAKIIESGKAYGSWA